MFFWKLNPSTTAPEAPAKSRRRSECLGMSIVVDKKSGNISLYQKTLILKILVTFGMEEAKPKKYTPLPPNVNLTD
jgi:hypothetical protein